MKKKNKKTLYEYLVKTFGSNTPIFISEIEFGDYSDIWIKKELSKLCNENKLIHYEKGIYYLPVETEVGLSELSPYKVIKKKYLTDGEEQYGYFSGLTLENNLGLTTQVPYVLELYTNKEKSNVREVTIGNQKVLLRKARCNITKANIATLIFLEIMSTLSVGAIRGYNKEKILKYINDNNITKNDVSKYSTYFPERTLRTLIESGVIYEIKQK